MAANQDLKKLKMEDSCPSSSIDSDYFESYSSLSIHNTMISDHPRTQTYLDAVKKHAADHVRGKVVLDVGCGTGILSIFCAKAGAKKVYAVDASMIARLAKKVVAENHVEDIVEVIQGKIEDLDLSEKVDVIISEWMGYCLLYENMFKSVLIARDRFLKPNGLMLPSYARIYAAPTCDSRHLESNVDFWDTVLNDYGVSMSSLKSIANAASIREVYVDSIPSDTLVSFPQIVKEFDCYTVTPDQIDSLCSVLKFQMHGMADVTGFVLWFDVDFEAPNQPHSLAQQPRLVLSTSPDRTQTHWQQTVFYLDEKLAVTQDDVFEGSMALSMNPTHPRYLDIALNLTFNGTTKISKSLTMKDRYVDDPTKY